MDIFLIRVLYVSCILNMIVNSWLGLISLYNSVQSTHQTAHWFCEWRHISFTNFKKEGMREIHPLKVWVIRINTVHVSKNPHLQTQLYELPSIPPLIMGNQLNWGRLLLLANASEQSSEALLCGLPERLSASTSTHLSFLSKSNKSALPQTNSVELSGPLLV